MGIIQNSFYLSFSQVEGGFGLFYSEERERVSKKENVCFKLVIEMRMFYNLIVIY